MKKLRQLKPQDVMFIGGETTNVYQHTAGLVLLDTSDTPDFCFDKYRHHAGERIDRIPQFRWRLHEVPLGLDLPYWVEDQSFNLDRHIRRIALPAPGDRDALVEVIAYLYSKHLDRSRPLWELWFIEGLAGDQYALFQKQHHCMMDGEGAVRLMDSLFDREPNAAPRDLSPDVAESRAGEVPEPWQESLNTARHLSRLPVESSRGLYSAIRHSIAKRLNPGSREGEKTTAPITSFNGDIGSDRGFVFGSLSLADIKAVKSHFGVTVNEVVLAVVSGSLRDYLSARGELPDQSLRTHIAVSLREDGDDTFSNKVTSRSVTLATDIADPALRLREIAEETERVKREARSRKDGMGFMEIMQLMPPAMVTAMMNVTPAEMMASMAGANLVISSVRGGEEPVYIAGARATAMYPMSVIMPGGGINVTTFSNAGNIDFGITIDPVLVPEPWQIADGLHKTLAAYLSPLRKRTTRKKKTAARKKKATPRSITSSGRKKGPTPRRGK